MTTLTVNLHNPKEAEVGLSSYGGAFWVDVATDNAALTIFVRTKEKANAIAAALNMKEPNT